MFHDSPLNFRVGYFLPIFTSVASIFSQVYRIMNNCYKEFISHHKVTHTSTNTFTPLLLRKPPYETLSIHKKFSILFSEKHNIAT